jgi:hypothetical protein
MVSTLASYPEGSGLGSNLGQEIRTLRNKNAFEVYCFFENIIVCPESDSNTRPLNQNASEQ